MVSDEQIDVDITSRCSRCEGPRTVPGRYCKGCRSLFNVERKQSQYDLICEYLSAHSCVDCGESDILVLEFDHLPKYEKSYAISTLIGRAVAWEIIQAEIDKCEVVCANCHRKRTAERSNNYRYRYGSR